MGKPKDEPIPFICSVGGYTFMIRYLPDHELHVLTCREDKSQNWQEKHPKGTSDARPSV